MSATVEVFAFELLLHLLSDDSHFQSVEIDHRKFANQEKLREKIAGNFAADQLCRFSHQADQEGIIISPLEADQEQCKSLARGITHVHSPHDAHPSGAAPKRSRRSFKLDSTH